MDIFKIYDEMGIDMRELMKLSAEKTSIEQLLVSQAVSQPFTDIETYKSAKAAYAFFKNLMGDDAFDKQTSGTSATYTLDLDSKSVAAALAKTALTEGAAMSGDDLVELTKAMNDSDFGMDLVIKTTNDALASYDLNGGMDFEGTAFTLDLTGTTFDTDMFMSMSVDGFIDMTMSMDMTMDETTKKVDLTLPAGAKVVDYESFLQ